MLIDTDLHLTYCTNIHPGESWGQVWDNLQRYLLPLRRRLAPGRPFGIGLRLSDQASRELGTGAQLEEFRRWLTDNDCYVFTMNGFPFGGFHREVVKDQVHQPDWTTQARVDYTRRLFEQLLYLMPTTGDAGISTSPLSYKPWYPTAAAREQATRKASRHLLELVDFLADIERRTGRYLHLDLEPEPDGFLENAEDTLAYFNDELLPMGEAYFADRMTAAEASRLIRRHLTLCYDVCHFAVAYEDHAAVLRRFHASGMQIGKVQISAALRADLPADAGARAQLRAEFERFDEPTYLHQVIARYDDGRRRQYPDLPAALADWETEAFAEWRTHFHVPIFANRYRHLQSTQTDIVAVLREIYRAGYSRHLEVETYTWEVLPDELQIDLPQSIERELRWVIACWDSFKAAGHSSGQ